MYYLFILIISINSYANSINGEEIRPPGLENLLLSSEQILKDINGGHFNSNVCKNYLSELEKNIDLLKVEKLSKKYLAQNGIKISDNLWSIRISLHQNLDQYSLDCINQIQSSFKQFRFIEEYLLEVSKKIKHQHPEDIKFQEQLTPILEDDEPHYIFKSKNNSNPTFMPGDILVTRGLSFLSSMIARLGVRGTQFSHIVFVNQNEKTKELGTIESYVGLGVQFYNLNFALKNENARILWLRSNDQKLAQKASREMTSLVQARLDENNKIKYDYSLDFDNNETMSCAEVSQVAFLNASNGQVKIPMYPNSIEGAKTLIDRLKIKDGPTYEPGDMEIDPRFELIGEFTDLRLTRDSRQKDAIMTMLFKWMNEKNYKLKDNFKSKLAGGFIYKARKTFVWPLIQRAFKISDFSKEIPPHMLSTVSLINSIGEYLLIEIRKEDLEFEKKNGLPMSYINIYEKLEELREKDLKLFQNKKTRKKAKFHKVFHP